MLIIGHRGAKGLAPENTLASLQAALDTRCSMVEIDVRVTHDGVAVLHHDSFAKDSSGQKHEINQINFGDLQLVKKDLLTLEAALQFIDRRVDMVIELKPGIEIDAVAACIQPRLEKSWIESDIILASRDIRILKSLKERFPNIPLAVIERWSGLRATRTARKLGTNRIIMNHRWIWGGFIRILGRSGVRLSVYTVNNPKRAKKLSKHGLYAVITDYPDRFND